MDDDANVANVLPKAGSWHRPVTFMTDRLGRANGNTRWDHCAPLSIGEAETMRPKLLGSSGSRSVGNCLGPTCTTVYLGFTYVRDDDEWTRL